MQQSFPYFYLFSSHLIMCAIQGAEGNKVQLSVSLFHPTSLTCFLLPPSSIVIFYIICTCNFYFSKIISHSKILFDTALPRF
jgi:hypothetical protein